MKIIPLATIMDPLIPKKRFFTAEEDAIGILEKVNFPRFDEEDITVLGELELKITLDKLFFADDKLFALAKKKYPEFDLDRGILIDLNQDIGGRWYQRKKNRVCTVTATAIKIPIGYATDGYQLYCNA